jgi:hypothetical protein
MQSLTNAPTSRGASPTGAFGLNTSRKYRIPTAPASCRKVRYASRVAMSRSRSLLNVTE